MCSYVIDDTNAHKKNASRIRSLFEENMWHHKICALISPRRGKHKHINILEKDSIIIIPIEFIFWCLCEEKKIKSPFLATFNSGCAKIVMKMSQTLRGTAPRLCLSLTYMAANPRRNKRARFAAGSVCSDQQWSAPCGLRMLRYHFEACLNISEPIYIFSVRCKSNPWLTDNKSQILWLADSKH